mmetsp:Transcript_12304/g.30132  ORF Transcript_12304/g.30132 Transcript_12304/m.30132 type:complete len:243 (-) Transcript_12304:121-849(-)
MGFPSGTRGPCQATFCLLLLSGICGHAAAFVAPHAVPGLFGSVTRADQHRSAASPPIAGAPLAGKLLGAFSQAVQRQALTRVRAAEEEAAEGDVHEMDVPQDTEGEPAEGFTRVYFEVEVKTKYGDQVYAAGSTGTLGSWKPEKGVALQTNKLCYPRWNALRDLPTGENFEYKYVILRRDGETKDWEDGIKNRDLTPEGMCTIVNDGKFGEPRTDEPFVEEREAVDEPGFFGKLLGKGSKKD